MRVSQNELKSLFKQAFEACGYDAGRYRVAAELVVWSQMHGLNVFPLVKQHMLPLAQDSIRVKVLLDQPQKIVFDNQGYSILTSASQIVNLANAKALNYGSCLVKVKNCVQPILITKALCDAKLFGLQIHAYWWDAETQKAIELRSNADQDGPEIFYYSNVNTLNNGELNVSFAKLQNTNNSELCSQRKNLFGNAQLEQHRTADYFVQQYQQSLDQGIEIEEDFWQQLLNISAKVLVESNEHSRLGAGD